jgi:AcrR family transcriptional regulator
MPRGPITEKYICDTFLEMTKSKSCLTIQVTEFAKYAKISRNTFYNYFNSIYDVIEKIENDFLAGIPTKDIIKSFKDEKSEFDWVIPTLHFMKENGNVLRILCGPNGDPAFQPKIIFRLTDLFNRMAKSHVPHVSKLERKIIGEYFIGGRWHALMWWLNNADEASINDIVKITKKIYKHMHTLVHKQ